MHTRTLTRWLLIAQITAMPLLADTASNMAESLMKLRAEVETLDASIQDEKDAYKASMKSLVMQKNDLEATIAREELQIKQLEQELAKVKKEIKEAGKNTEGLKPLLLDAIAQLEARIKASLPFKTNERLSDLGRIRTQLEQDLVTPQKALAMTWNSYDDAIRMSKENGIFKQTISLDGKDRLVEVARIGSVMMFFKTPDERAGYVQKSKNGWVYTEELNAENQDRIIALFDAFRKQIRTGYFVLPNALAEVN